MSLKPADSLRQLHTFGMEAKAGHIDIAETVSDLCRLWQAAQTAKSPFLLLGGGSNVLFTADFNGSVVVNRIPGRIIRETPDAWLIEAGAGENWHELIRWMLANGIYGMENLALIPGCAGTAPIQNIGAYGTEFKDVCDYVDITSLSDGKTTRLTAAECRFGYRDSIFKHDYQQGYAITAVGLKLPKTWKPNLSYGDLKSLDPATVTPQQVFDMVCRMRMSKLPDPAVTGNAGSFFKNPVVTAECAQKIKAQYPDCPQYVADNGIKLAAGWLIDQCRLKGHQEGGAAVHMNQALVLINRDNATGDDVIRLARYVRQQVAARFGVQLEPEVRFIGADGEISATEAIA
ncbi:UDP-N-acetylmuramate dehydrogenase [Morganella morganii]|uniref:UDP-N-acetylmuramate dehydrogenase n=1 Tax=Morganella morganii TaxID=582 RepID=UPI003EB95EA6